MVGVAVVGSLNIDHVLKVDKLPVLGETVSSNNYILSEGGKGANQAVAIGKLGLKVHMFGKIGDDEHGQLLVNSLKNANVYTEGIIIDERHKTGAAFITIDNNGNNTVVVNPGANGRLDLKDIKKIESLIFDQDILLLQMEIPKDIVIYIIKRGKELNKLILLNLSPAMEMDNFILNMVDYLILNESEIGFLTNVKCSIQNMKLVIKKIREFYHNKLIITLGPDGAAYSISDDDFKTILTFDVATIDKTGAGDAFIGGFVYGLSKGLDIKTCINLGNASGSIATTIIGAQKSLPTKDQLNNFLSKNNLNIII
ncbi:MAG: ribokinase [Actinobacteria bacterium]|nr:ribokinase [Actinomycetota bacterium]